MSDTLDIGDWIECTTHGPPPQPLRCHMTNAACLALGHQYRAEGRWRKVTDPEVLARLNAQLEKECK